MYLNAYLGILHVYFEDEDICVNLCNIKLRSSSKVKLKSQLRRLTKVQRSLFFTGDKSYGIVYKMYFKKNLAKLNLKLRYSDINSTDD